MRTSEPTDASRTVYISTMAGDEILQVVRLLFSLKAGCVLRWITKRLLLWHFSNATKEVIFLRPRVRHL